MGVIKFNSNQYKFETRYHSSVDTIYIEDSQKRLIRLNDEKELQELIELLVTTRNEIKKQKRKR